MIYDALVGFVLGMLIGALIIVVRDSLAKR